MVGNFYEHVVYNRKCDYVSLFMYVGMPVLLTDSNRHINLS